MAFDFKARAYEREQEEARESQRKRDAEEKRWNVAANLSDSFLEYATSDLYRHQLTASRHGTTVTFNDGGRVAEVVVRDPALFDVSMSKIELDGDPSSEVRRARATSDEDLMDLLTAWALNRR